MSRPGFGVAGPVPGTGRVIRTGDAVVATPNAGARSSRCPAPFVALIGRTPRLASAPKAGAIPARVSLLPGRQAWRS